MNQILRCDWLPERARWSYLARWGLPAASRRKNFPESHTINPLLTKLIRSGWLDIGHVLFLFFFFFLACLRTSTPSRFINTQKKELGQYPAILSSHLVNNPYVRNNGRMWTRRVDHVRRDSMDRAVSEPSTAMESQDNPRPSFPSPDNPLAVPLSLSVPSPSQVPSQKDVLKKESGQRQATGGSSSHCSREGSISCHTTFRSDQPYTSPIF